MKSLIILIWGGILMMIIEFFAFWYGMSEIYTGTGIHGFIALTLWIVGCMVFKFAENLSEEFIKSKVNENEWEMWVNNA